MVTMQKAQPEAKLWRNFSLRGLQLEEGAEAGAGGVGAGAGRSVKSWIMLMPEGKYEHPTYGELNFTAAKLAEFKRNFDRRTRKIDIAFDEDHNAGKATGWLERVELRPAMADAPAGLWGLVAWTPLGQQLLSDRMYGYFSPEFGDFQDEETGETFSNVIIGGALTNRPYLKVMPAVRLAEISHKPWGSIDKSTLPRSAFLIKGDPDKKETWKLPIKEASGAININGVRAALQAIHGAHTGTPMSGVPAGTVARLQNLLKRYGGSNSGGGADSKSAREDGGGMVKTYRLMSGTTGPQSPIPDGDDEPDYGLESAKMSARKKAADVQPLPSPADDEDSERFADADTDGNDETMDDMSSNDDGDGFDPDSNTHGAASTDGHMHGKFGSHSHDGDADHSDAPVKASSKKASSKKASEEHATGREADHAEVLALREELRQVKYQLYEGEVGKILEGWQANEFQFSEGGAKKAGRITTSKVFDDAYRAYMLSDGVRLSDTGRKKLNALIEKALSTGIVDLTQRGTSFDQESRRTVHKGGERGATFDEEVALEDEAERISLAEFHKPLAKLDFATQLEVRIRAEKQTGYGSKRA